MKKNFRLFPYQKRAVKETESKLAAGQRALIVSPAGSGKTAMAAAVARNAYRQQRRTVFVSHRREILNQFILHVGYLKVPESAVSASYPQAPIPYSVNAHIQVVSVQVLMRREDTTLLDAADLIVFDEAQHIVADGQAPLFEARLRLVGLTATPFRLDGRGLADMFDALVVAATPSQLIKQKQLTKPRVFTRPDLALPDWSTLRRSMGDFTVASMNTTMNTSELTGDIVDHYRRRAKGKTAIVFASSVLHSQALVQRFVAAGHAAEHLDSTTPLADRDAIIERLHAGITKVISNVAVLSEGFDLPHTYAVILARPTLSLALYLQQAGRGMRWYHGERSLLLDHAGNVQRFGFPEADREYDLVEGVVPEDPTGLPPTRTCPACDAILPVQCRVCPECGEELRPIRTPQEDAQIALKELTRQRKAQFMTQLEPRIDAFLAERSFTKKDAQKYKARLLEVWTAVNSDGV